MLNEEKHMIGNPVKAILEVNAVGIDDYIVWLKNILKVTGLSVSSLFLFIFIFWLVLNVLLAILVEVLPLLKAIVRILEFLLLPGSLMHMVWHVFAAKKLNIPTEQQVSFGYGWSRAGIKLDGRLKTLREGIIFFWAPIMNLPILIGWVIPGMVLFQWLDTLMDGNVFYWIWFYVLISLLIYGLPDMADLVNPFQITVVKTPEFYLFTVFYVIIAPITLLFWGWGITIIFSLIYAITSFYEIQKISKKEEQRLGSKWDKVLSKKPSAPQSGIVIITDKE